MAEKLTKVFTRDFSLFISQWWAHAQEENFNRLLGVGYTDTPAAHDGLSAAYFYLEKDWAAIGSAVVGKIQADPDFYFRVRPAYLQNVADARVFLKAIEGQEPLSVDSVTRLRAYLSGLYPVIRFTYAIPSHWADALRKAVGQAAEKTISAALEDRASTEGVFEAIDGCLRRMAEGSLSGFGKSKKLAKFLTSDELDVLAQGKPVDWADVSARTGGYTYCRGKLFLTTDSACVFEENGYSFEEVRPQSDVLVGSVAFDGGLICVKVRRIFALEQLDSLRQGEILVCPMTVPDYVPVMKKAAAVVTDEGGMGCHAAIVCRELRIPCVVGTQCATQLLHDGDDVDVDTSSGKVRKVT